MAKKIVTKPADMIPSISTECAVRGGTPNVHFSPNIPPPPTKK